MLWSLSCPLSRGDVREIRNRMEDVMSEQRMAELRKLNLEIEAVAKSPTGTVVVLVTKAQAALNRAKRIKMVRWLAQLMDSPSLGAVPARSNR